MKECKSLSNTERFYGRKVIVKCTKIFRPKRSDNIRNANENLFG